MDFLKGKNRLGLYLFLLAVLAVGALAAIWSVTGTGAYLTGEGDWQSLAGDYRIGTIDYNVKINDELLLGRNPGGQDLVAYKLAVPISGGVKIFDENVSNADRSKEFNEGATLVQVRVANYSKNMVDVTAQFSFLDQTAKTGVPSIRMLALPTTLNRVSAAYFDRRKYIMDTLGNPADLSALDAAYTAAMFTQTPEGALVPKAVTLELGLLPGSTSVDPGVGDDQVVQDGDSWCYYKDVFLIVWTEYGDGEFNTAAPAPTGTPRQGQFTASFTVGQLD